MPLIVVEPEREAGQRLAQWTPLTVQNEQGHEITLLVHKYLGTNRLGQRYSAHSQDMRKLYEVQLVGGERLQPEESGKMERRASRGEFVARAMGGVGILPVLFHGEYEQNELIVRPYAGGWTLGELVDKHVPGWVRLAVLAAAARILHRAHTCPERCVHTALTPDAIVLGATGEVFVQNWEATFYEGRHTITRTRIAPAAEGYYLALEQIRANACVNEHTDVFALGAILYYCLVGRHAFPPGSFRELAQLRLNPTPDELVSLVEHALPNGVAFAPLLTRSISADPEEPRMLGGRLGALGFAEQVEATIEGKQVVFAWKADGFTLESFAHALKQAKS